MTVAEGTISPDQAEKLCTALFSARDSATKRAKEFQGTDHARETEYKHLAQAYATAVVGIRLAQAGRMQ